MWRRWAIPHGAVPRMVVGRVVSLVTNVCPALSSMDDLAFALRRFVRSLPTQRRFHGRESALAGCWRSPNEGNDCGGRCNGHVSSYPKSP
jgi:hypothetical protein